MSRTSSVFSGGHRLNIPRVFSLALYLIFVWGMAYIKKDYIWFNGDSANLLQQSLLMARGLLPNIDFLSGYPGLDIQINSLLISVMDSSVMSQQIYMALVASLLGAIFFWFLDGLKPWFITLTLLFIYSQGLYVNPAPNPGHLFAATFILGLVKTIDFFDGYRLRDAAAVGFFFSVSFLAKQYGVFGPLCFFIATSAFLENRLRFKERLFPILLGGLSGVFIFFYVRGMYLFAPSHGQLLLNVFLFTAPTVAAVGIFIYRPTRVETAPLSLMRIFQANFICGGVFLIVAALYLVSLYGYENIPEVVSQFLVKVPRKINQSFAPVSFSFPTTLAILFALVFFALPFSAFSPLSEKFKKYFYLFKSATLCLSLFLVFLSPSLHMTVFIVIAYVLLLLFVKNLLSGRQSKILYAVIAGFAPCMALLIPWPNPAYHIPILMFFMLIALQLQSRNMISFSPPRWIAAAPYFIALVIVSILLLFYPYNLGREKLLHWKFANLEFTSADKNWEISIKEAAMVTKHQGACTNHGCRFLVFSTPWKIEYIETIEKP